MSTGFHQVTRHKVATSVSYNRPFLYVQDTIKRYEMAPNSVYEKYVDTAAQGILQVFEMQANNKDVGVEIKAYGPGNTVFCNLRATYAGLLAGGFGLTPGDCTPIGGVSPDITGVEVPQSMYLLRYKDTTDEDILGSSSKHFSLMYAPSPPLEYMTRLQIRIFNESAETILVTRAVAQRMEFAQPDEN